MSIAILKTQANSTSLSPNIDLEITQQVAPSKLSPTEITSPNPNIICNFKNPLVSREQLNIKTGATNGTK